MKISLYVIILFYSLTSFGQNSFQGKVVDQKTGEALAYANIGILGKSVGTVSAMNGSFEIKLNTQHDEDVLKISMIGYKSFSLKVAKFKNKINKNPTIELVPTSFDLQEIVVVPKNLKTKVLGNKTNTTAITGGFASNDLGAEMGIIIKIKKRPTYIQDFNVHISSCDLDTIKLRLNFYDIKKGLPNKKIVKQDIIISHTSKKGRLKVDLRDYNIVMEDDFFVSLEWLEDFGEKDLHFSLKLFGKPMIYRNTSHADWKKIKAGGVGFYLTTMY